MYFKEKKIVELGKNPEILIERKMSNRKDRKLSKVHFRCANIHQKGSTLNFCNFFACKYENWITALQSNKER